MLVIRTACSFIDVFMQKGKEFVDRIQAYKSLSMLVSLSFIKLQISFNEQKAQDSYT